MLTGCVFDVREFTVQDGPGVRVTVFLKGCPLHCPWCHNPEGIAFGPQKNLRSGKLVGRQYTAEELAGKLAAYRDFFRLSGGGVTFSGGEATAQPAFLYEVAKRLQGIHKVLDTSGDCAPEVFQRLSRQMDLFYYDLKLADAKSHEKYTGRDNAWILENLAFLASQNRPYHIRVPLIPQITDTAENLAGIERILCALPFPPQAVDLLSYNKLAAGKYPMFAMEYPLAEWYTENCTAAIASFAKRMSAKGFLIHQY